MAAGCREHRVVPDHSDWVAYLAREEVRKRQQREKQRASIIPQLRDVAQKAQQVMDHPGWQWYADKIAERVQQVEQMRQQTTQTMVFSTAMGHELELLKIQLNTLDAEMRGLTYAVTLIPQAVKVGQQIAGDAQKVIQ